MGLTAEWKRVLSAAALALIGLSVFAEPKVPADWKTDCVGRMQISLPGEVDIAAMLPKDFINDVSGQGSSGNKFLDGQDASWSSFGFEGRLDIAHPTTAEEKARINESYKKAWSFARTYSKSQGKPPLIELLNDTQRGKAWRGDQFYTAYLHVERVSLRWGASSELSDMPSVAKDYQTLISGLRPRPSFDVPKDSGVCVPYLFIKDEGKNHRHIGTIYRLKAHPDITVWLEDSSAATIGPHMDPAKFTDKAKAAFFWEQRYANRRSFQSLWPFHYAFKDTTMAGQEGVKTFVELTRDDEAQTKDYGYLVAVRGDPDAKEDTPDLMLYVIQDSVNATKRGIKPLDKDAFLDMAETIAASVRRREASR